MNLKTAAIEKTMIKPVFNTRLRRNNIRLQVFLSHAGVSSRRAAEGIIAQGRVSVNGITITSMGAKVKDGDIINLDGKPLQLETRLLYLALNKPSGYICACAPVDSHKEKPQAADLEGRPLAISLLPKDIKERLYNIGRLDFLSCGLIFFTNDGKFAARLGHPSCGIEKEYLVEASGHIPNIAIEAFNKGITIEDIHYRAKLAERVNRKTIRVILIEGKNREIRRVFSHFHLHALTLKRIRIGPVLLGGLQEGQTRHLTEEELSKLN